MNPSQSPSASSSAKVCRNMLSDVAAILSNLLVGLLDLGSSFASIANLDSTPGSVDRKKGAFSGALGGSFGLLRS